MPDFGLDIVVSLRPTVTGRHQLVNRNRPETPELTKPLRALLTASARTGMPGGSGKWPCEGPCPVPPLQREHAPSGGVGDCDECSGDAGRGLCGQLHACGLCRSFA